VSNVLIGIIGVILFIGLALAGALFLGPRFQEATNSSRASAVVAATADVQRAHQMFVLQEGRKQSTSNTRLSTTDFINGRYLKSAPGNPTLDGVAGPDTYALGPNNDTTHVLTAVAGSNAKAICEVIQKQFRTTNADGSINDTPRTAADLLTLPAQSDCVKPSGNIGPVSTGFTGYLFYMKV
jgi:type II secretory pathway pseudopilin PulG